MSLPKLHLAALAVALAAAGCAPKIGDSCKNGSDCSVTGDRVCDLTQPGGYCTVQFCDPDSCPDDAVCVEWLYDPPRTAQTWCMKRCSDDGDCRGGYHCLEEGDPALTAPDGKPLARIADIKSHSDESFCAALSSMPQLDASVPDGAAPDAAMPDASADGSTPDAAVPDGAAPDAAMPDAAMPDGAAPDAAIPDGGADAM